TDEELAARPDAAAHLAGAEAYLERFDDCIAHAARGVEVARATGQTELVPTLIPALWTGLWMKGRLVAGAELMDGALEAARLAGNRQTLSWQLLNRGLGAVITGDLDIALALSGEGWELAQELEDSFVLTWTGMVLGCAYVEHGAPARAAELLV